MARPQCSFTLDRANKLHGGRNESDRTLVAGRTGKRDRAAVFVRRFALMRGCAPPGNDPRGIPGGRLAGPGVSLMYVATGTDRMRRFDMEV